MYACLFRRGLRAPIECKIMAVCRIFASTTVTNISDKASPCPRCPTLMPVPVLAFRSRVPARRAVSYLSILIYRELIFRRYHIFDPERGGGAGGHPRILGDINLKVPARRPTRALHDFIAARSFSRIKLRRCAPRANVSIRKSRFGAI